MQINQINGEPIGFGFGFGGPSSNFLNPVNSKSQNPAVSSKTSLMNTTQSAQTSSALGRQILSSANICQTSDVVKTLRQHPAYMEMSQREIEAIAAVILSLGCVAGGMTLFAASGGSSAPISIALASIALTSGGVTGATKAIQGAIRGNFDWCEWGKEVFISAGSSLITFGAGYTAAAGLTYLCLNHPSIVLSSRAIESIAQVSGAFAGSAAKGTTHYVIKEWSGEKVETFELILEIVSGAFSGLEAGKMAANAQFAQIMRGQLVVGHKTHGKGFYKEGTLLTKGSKKLTVFTTKGEIIGQDISLMSQKIKCTTPIGGKVLVLSGSHGNTNGATVLDDITLAAQEFFNRDRDVLIPNALELRKRTVSILNLADFREQGTLYQAIMHAKPDVIVTNFCHGDVAMQKGKLGLIISQAFQDM